MRLWFAYQWEGFKQKLRGKGYLLVQALIVLGVLVAFASVLVTAYKFGTDSRQDNDIQEVRVGLDREARERITTLEKQRRVDEQQDKIQSAQIDRNRRLLLAILKLRDKNPELFEGINLPITAGYIEQTEANDDAKEAVESGRTPGPRPTPKPVKPKPTKPRPTASTPTPRPEITAPTPTPIAPTPAPTPVTPAPTPVVPVQPPVPPAPGPIITLPLGLGEILNPLLPPILNPILG